ncbi:hypothetical protein [Phenylobacterium sp.]|uniref:hypothetical protein n=1 Tax=Phenylobacterium sp. TaxID=1871053 RepID=UPI002F9293D0
MTLVIAESASTYSVMVSDRLTTKWRGTNLIGRFDEVANKTVVFLSGTEGVAIGYTGNAFLERMPTDEWIAQQLWGDAFMLGPHGDSYAMYMGPPKVRRSVPQALFHLQARLAATRGGQGVTLLATGWRRRRGRLTPLLVTITARRNRRTQADMRMRRPTSLLSRRASVGASLTATVAVPSMPGLHPVRALGQGLAAAIRNVSRTDRTVGPHVMQVLMIPGQVVCEFLPEAEHVIRFGDLKPSLAVPTAYSPWILSDGGYVPPQLIGGGPVRVPGGGWLITMAGARPLQAAGAPAAFVYSQRRPKAP